METEERTFPDNDSNNTWLDLSALATSGENGRQSIKDE
jgi:hypothetical protein